MAASPDDTGSGVLDKMAVRGERGDGVKKKQKRQRDEIIAKDPTKMPRATGADKFFQKAADDARQLGFAEYVCQGGPGSAGLLHTLCTNCPEAVRRQVIAMRKVEQAFSEGMRQKMKDDESHDTNKRSHTPTPDSSHHESSHDEGPEPGGAEIKDSSASGSSVEEVSFASSFTCKRTTKKA